MATEACLQTLVGKIWGNSCLIENNCRVHAIQHFCWDMIHDPEAEHHTIRPAFSIPRLRDKLSLRSNDSQRPLQRQTQVQREAVHCVDKWLSKGLRPILCSDAIETLTTASISRSGSSKAARPVVFVSPFLPSVHHGGGEA